ncbi:MAG: class I SAM-dependent methyltransferase, partial [Candidatus Omnitrophota bacterium]
DIEKYSSGKKILDIGCAMGLFLEAAQMRGWDPYGIEVSEYAANIAKDKFGSRVTIGKLEDTDFPPESFDVVTMFDVIEHMLLPVEPLQRILKILRPQGLLAISTINTESLSCKLMRLAWPHFKSEHANYFSPFNIKLVLDRAGFRILEIKDSKKFLSLGYVKSYFDSYGMPFAATFLNLFSIVIPAALRDYPFKTRLGEMLVLARKIG